MNTTTYVPVPDAAPQKQPRPPWVRVAIAVAAVVLVALLGVVAGRLVRGGDDPASRPFPQSTQMETALGVRFSRVAVVGDGGLVTVSYVVLDVDKATRFLGDTKHPPTLRSEARSAFTTRVSMMRQGHINRAGATYYFVYQNTGGALRSGEEMTIESSGLRLEHVPVL
jgi:hypothetical protein